MLSEMAQNWWLFLARGFVAILFGVLAIIWPAQAWLALVVLFGAFALLDGIITLIIGIDFSHYFNHWWVVALEGVVGIVIGLLTLFWLRTALQALIYVIAAWAIITGIFEIMAGIRFRLFIVGEWSMIVAGILSILLGILLFVFPAEGLRGLVWMIGIYAIFFGITQIVFSSRLHGFQNLTSSGEVPEN